MLNINSLSPKLFVHSRLVRVAGNAFEISVVADDKQWADERIDNAVAEIDRVLALLSVDDEQSQINQINRKAGLNPVKVDQEIFHLISRALKISDLTRGAFDITSKTDDAASFLSYRDVILDPKKSTVYLTQKGMSINLGRIVNGYATDRVKYILMMQGVGSGIVNAFGDLITWGRQPDNSPWTIDAVDPEQKLKAFTNLNISNMAVSVDSRQNVHSLSVSVLSPSAELAAAMSAPVKVMGVKMSLNLFNRLNQLVCVIVNNRKRVYTTKSIAAMMC